jgi:hypothetical protein
MINPPSRTANWPRRAVQKKLTLALLATAVAFVFGALYGYFKTRHDMAAFAAGTQTLAALNAPMPVSRNHLLMGRRCVGNDHGRDRAC